MATEQNNEALAEQINALIISNLQGQSQGALKDFMQNALEAIERVPVLQKRGEERRLKIEEQAGRLKAYERQEAELATREDQVAAYEIINTAEAHRLEVESARMEGKKTLYSDNKEFVGQLLANRQIRESVVTTGLTPVVDANGYATTQPHSNDTTTIKEEA